MESEDYISSRLNQLDPATRAGCKALMAAHLDRFRAAAGSSCNHQAWPGGYLDHVAETMRIAEALYRGLSLVRPPPFRLNDALLVMFLHDLEKPWKKDQDLRTKKDRRDFRDSMISAWDIHLSNEQRNALLYVEGEGDDYSPHRRVMGELAAFCHMCDVASARIWHDHPKSA